MAGPLLCDACVAKYDGIVPIYPIFHVPLPTYSVDSRLLPRCYSVFPYPPPLLVALLRFVTNQSFLSSTKIERYTRLYPF